MLIGRGAAAVLTSSTGHKPRILIGKDTRQSGDMLEAALTAGLCSVGADVESLGVVPTPAVAYLVRKYNADGRRGHLGVSQPDGIQRHQNLRRHRLQAAGRGGERN